MRQRPQVLVLIGAVLVCAIVAGVFFIKRASEEAQAVESAQRFTPAAPTGAPTQSAVAVTVIGDDLAVPAQAGTPVAVFPTLLQRDLGDRVVSLSSAGSGYTTRPLTSMYGGTFVARAAQVATSSRVVLLIGGANDQRAGRVQLLRAASAAISTAQQRAPRATVVVVGPLSPEAQAPSSLLAVRDVLRDAASRGEARFVDPIAQGWLQDGTGYLAADGSTLTLKAQREIASRLTLVLRPLL